MMLILAGMAPAATAAPAAPAARVQRQSVVHPQKCLRVRVPASARYAGAERFTLNGAADAEIHVFVEADSARRVKRFYWIQFETYLPDRPELRFNYSDNRPAQLWGHVTWTGAGPRQTGAAPRPGSDGEQVRAILRRAGYSLPAEMMNARLVQILDDPGGTGRGRDELMLIYSEDLAPTGRTYAELVKDAATTAAWEPLEAPLIAKAAAAFKVERRKAGKRRAGCAAR